MPGPGSHEESAFQAYDTPEPLRACFDAFTAALPAGTRHLDLVAEVIWSALHGLAALARDGRIPPQHQDVRLDTRRPGTSLRCRAVRPVVVSLNAHCAPEVGGNRALIPGGARCEGAGVSPEIPGGVVGTSPAPSAAVSQGRGHVTAQPRHRPFNAFHADGERVVVEETMTATLANGNHYVNDYCFVFELRDELIHRVREYMDTARGHRMIFGEVPQ